MATTFNHRFIGIDVSKTELVICADSALKPYAIENSPSAIKCWLSQLPEGPWAIALEATSSYHIEFVCQAHRQKHTVYLLDGFRLNRYRESIGNRAKTDASDAALLRRYLTREIDELRVWEPTPEGFEAINHLLRRRATLTQHQESIRQSTRDLRLPKPELEALWASFKQLILKVDQRIEKMMKTIGWEEERRRCAEIEGIGKLTSTAITVAWHRGHFRSADAFVSYLGMDVRVRDSGNQRGRRKLTKKGDPELRRLLYCAAMAAARSATWKPFYDACRSRGLSPIQTYVALGRKLLRIAFSLLKNETRYAPRVLENST